MYIYVLVQVEYTHIHVYTYTNTYNAHMYWKEKKLVLIMIDYTYMTNTDDWATNTETALCYAKPLWLCPTLCDPMDCSPLGSSVHGISQARILEWVAIPFYRGSSQHRDQTQVSCIAGRFFTTSTTWEAQNRHIPG